MTYPQAKLTSNPKIATAKKVTSAAADAASQNPIVSFWLASNLVSLSLSLLPVPYAGYASSVALSGVNVGFACLARSKRLVAAAERAGKLDRSQFERNMARLEDDQKALLNAQNTVNAKISQLLAEETALTTREATMRDRLMVEAARAAQRKVDEMQARLNAALQDKASMQATYQEKQAESAKKTGLIVSKVQQDKQNLGDSAAKALSVSNKVLADEREQVNKELEKLAREIQVITQELAAHKELVAKLQGPKFFKQATVEGDIANQIITQMALGDDKVSLSEHHLSDTKYGECVMSFEPIGCGVEDVNGKIGKVAVAIGLAEIPKAYYGGDGTIKMRVRVSGDRKPKAAVIHRISDARLKQAFLDVNYGLRTTGYTGRGKSTLLNNIIGLYEQEMGQPFTIFDPKVDFPSAEYPHNKVYRGPKKCVENIDLIGLVCEARQDYRVLNDEQGVPIPAQHQVPRLFLIDECKDIHDSAALADLDLKASERHYVKDFKFSIQKGLEVGRGLKVRVIYSTVTPDSSDFGFKNSVFKQSATVFLGDQCYEALSTKSQYLTTVSDEQKALLRKEYEARVESKDERDNFIGLFFNGGTNEVFLFSPPDVGAWKTAKKEQKLKTASEGVSPQIENQPTFAASQASPALQVSPVSPQPEIPQPLPQPSRSFPQSPPQLSAVTVDALKQAQIKCPHCEAIANSFRDKRVRKSDSTVRVRCKTKGCVSGGDFRVKVSS